MLSHVSYTCIIEIYSSGSMESEEYVDGRYEFVDGQLVQARTTGSSLNTSTRALTPTLTNTQWKYMWSLSMQFYIVGPNMVVIVHSNFSTI